MKVTNNITNNTNHYARSDYDYEHRTPHTTSKSKSFFVKSKSPSPISLRQKMYTNTTLIDLCKHNIASASRVNPGMSS